MHPILRRLPLTLGLSAVFVLACLAPFMSPGGTPRAREPGTTVAGTFWDEVRNAAAWLDEKTTPPGAFLWPLTGDVCGLPQR